MLHEYTLTPMRSPAIIIKRKVDTCVLSGLLYKSCEVDFERRLFAFFNQYDTIQKRAFSLLPQIKSSINNETIFSSLSFLLVNFHLLKTLCNYSLLVFMRKIQII